MPLFLLMALCGVAGLSVGLRADLRRRNLSLVRCAGWSLLTILDVACVALTIGLTAGLVVLSSHMPSQRDSLFSPATLAILASIAGLLFLWPEGRRQVQLQRPAGIVFGEWAFLFGAYDLLAAYGFHQPFWFGTESRAAILLGALLPVTVGAVVLLAVVPRFVTSQEEHRILDRIAAQGEFVQSEWASPTPECPSPHRWHMVDAQSAEIEVLDFLKSLVLTTKPDLILETGTFVGHSSMKMAEGLRENGFGRIITVEYDGAVFAKAKQNIDESGLGKWIEYRNASSLETTVDSPIDILYSDSDVNIRESEIRHFLPQIKPRGLVLVHDAGSNFKVVRDAALRLEQEGLLSVVLLSTPRGLVVAQKREGRT
jgi:predicted O-methyltransferase YrrM